MMALSIRQPWCFAILHLGKRLENRTWSTRYRGPILIHASKAMTRDEYDEVSFFVQYHYPELAPAGAPDLMLPPFDDLDRGGIVGRANLVDCVRSKQALPFGKSRAWGDMHIVPWWQGPVGFVLDDVQPLPFVPCKGKLGLFETDIRVDVSQDGRAVDLGSEKVVWRS